MGKHSAFQLRNTIQDNCGCEEVGLKSGPGDYYYYSFFFYDDDFCNCDSSLYYTTKTSHRPAKDLRPKGQSPVLVRRLNG